MSYLTVSRATLLIAMCVIVTATIPADQFALRETLADTPGVAFELVQHVAHRAGTLSLVWGTVPDGAAGDEDIAELVRSDSTVSSVEVLTTADGASLLRIEWDSSMQTVISDIIGTQGTVTSASATAGGWNLQFLFPDREAVADTNHACDRHGVEVDFRSIRTLSGSRRRSKFDLTESQHETLLAAHQAGYYQVPRGVKLAELASEMGVSHQTLSERLRRGHCSLVGNALVGDATSAHVEIM